MIRKGLASFHIGLNQDVEDRNLQVGEYREALNVLPGESDGSTNGAVPTELGNTLVSYTLASGTNKCIGTVQNKEDDSIIYFIYNSNNDHKILEYLTQSNTIVPIVESKSHSSGTNYTTEFLNFQSDESIHSANVFDGNLTWCSDKNPPRHIEIQRAKDYLDTIPGPWSPSETFFPWGDLVRTGTADQKEQFIEAIKRPPLCEPTISYATDASQKTNELRGKLWQFRYRYVYTDFSRSVFSPISQISLPEDDETGIGAFNSKDTQAANNRIDIVVETGHPQVRTIEIAFRKGNIGTWYLIDDYIDKYNEDNDSTGLPASNTTETYQWYGEFAGRALADSEVVPNYDAVPLIAKTQELLTNNRLAYGNYKWGYDNTDLDVTLDLTTNIYTTGRTRLDWPERGVANIPNDYFGLDTNLNLILPTSIGDVPDGTVISGIVQVDEATDFADPISAQFSYVKKSTDTTLAILATNIDTEVSRVAVTASSGTVSGRNAVILTTGGSFNRKFLALNVGAPISKEVTWKKGAKHNFGIQYTDAQGRTDTVNINDNMSIYVPFFSENPTYQGVKIEENSTVDYGISVEIRHAPPSWATKWQLVYGGSNISYYIQGVMDWGVMRDGQIADNVVYPDRISLYVPSFAKAIADPKTPTYGYSWEEGDRIRFITNKDGEVLDDYVDVEVLGYDPASQTLQVESFDFEFYPELFEIYRVRPESKPLEYIEIGDCHDVTGGFHVVNNKVSGEQDQTTIGVSGPAIVHLDRGQTYYIDASFKASELYLGLNASSDVERLEQNEKMKHYTIEHMSWSFYYESDSYDGGRINLFAKNARQQWYHHHWLYGGLYMEGSKLNNVFRYSLNDDQKVDVNNGEITRLAMVGFTLKILQEYKLTSAYIARRVLFNSNKDSQIISTDDVVGELQPANHGWGTQHPESVVVWNRYMYYFDARNGKYIRDSANGAIPISDYGMKSYFKGLADDVRSQGAMVLSTVNERNGVVTVCALTTETNTISFHESPVEGRSRWKMFHSYKPERFGFVGSTLVSFKDGALWLHNSNSTRCNFYGVQEGYSIKFVLNPEPESVKTFLSLWVQSNQEWFAPTKGDIQVPANEIQSSGQQTRILEGRFTYEEGMYSCEIPRDMNTPNMTETQGLINGNVLRGHVLQVKLTGNKTDEVVLRSVIMNYVKSNVTV